MALYEINFTVDGVTISGPQGLPGAPGLNGSGVPGGGTIGQILTKTGSADGAVGWSNGATGNASLTSDQTFTGVNQFSQGIFIADSTGLLWQVTVNTDGSLVTTQYYGGTALPSNAITTEDGNFFIVTEDLNYYVAQE